MSKNKNRQITFRGKKLDNGEWVCGALFDGLFLTLILDTIVQKGVNNFQTVGYEVDPETVGQYMGFKDKNGTKVFEGDVISLNGNEICAVKWGSAVEKYLDFILFKTLLAAANNQDCIEDLMVVGNIHDNPELLSICTNREGGKQ